MRDIALQVARESKDTETVQCIMIRFPELLYELGLSGRERKT